MPQYKNPGALAGATGVKKPNYAIAASFFTVDTQHCFGQSYGHGLDNGIMPAQDWEDFQCK